MKEFKSELLNYWDDLVGTEGFNPEDTDIMKAHWDKSVDMAFAYHLYLLF